MSHQPNDNLAIVEWIRDEGLSLEGRIQGDSMLPLLKRGQTVILASRPAGCYRVGDVIAYRKNECNVVHRIVRKLKSDGKIFYLCKGDHNLFCDPPVLPGQVLAKVISLKEKFPYGTAVLSDWEARFCSQGKIGGLFSRFLRRLRFQISKRK